MTVRIAWYVRATHDVVDEAFLQECSQVEAVKADSLESFAELFLKTHAATFRARRWNTW